MKNVVPIAAIIGLVVMECVALSLGFNGTLFTSVAAIVGGIGGYYVARPSGGKVARALLILLVPLILLGSRCGGSVECSRDSEGRIT